jgi:predicted GNAT family acetyltransferase
MDTTEAWAHARALREQMLREGVAPDDFVIGPDYAGSVGTRVLDVYGDAALEFLRSVDRQTLMQGSILVRGDAPRVSAFLDSFGVFTQEHQTGMLGTDLARVPRASLPDPLRLTRVQLGDRTDPSLPTAAAFAAAVEAEDGPPPGSMLPALTRMADRSAVDLFAAVDEDGSIQATSGATATGEAGMVFGIGTMAAWRGRGAATAMTAVAVHGAAQLGATTLLLDATDAGASIYRRLGFTAYAPAVEWHTRH